MKSSNQLRKAATKACAFLATKNIKLPYNTGLELVARIQGFEDLHHAQGDAAAHKTPAPLTVPWSHECSSGISIPEISDKLLRPVLLSRLPSAEPDFHRRVLKQALASESTLKTLRHWLKQCKTDAVTDGERYFTAFGDFVAEINVEDLLVPTETKIPLEDAIEILASVTAVAANDGVLLYPNLVEDREEDGVFLKLERDDFNESFSEKDNLTVAVGGPWMHLINTQGEETTILLLQPAEQNPRPRAVQFDGLQKASALFAARKQLETEAENASKWPDILKKLDALKTLIQFEKLFKEKDLTLGEIEIEQDSDFGLPFKGADWVVRAFDKALTSTELRNLAEALIAAGYSDDDDFKVTIDFESFREDYILPLIHKLRGHVEFDIDELQPTSHENQDEEESRLPAEQEQSLQRLTRDEIAKILEDHDFQVYDHEDKETLLTALRVNILDGTISASVLDN